MKNKRLLMILLVVVMTFGMTLTSFADFVIKDKSGAVLATLPDLPDDLKENYVIHVNNYSDGRIVYSLTTSDNEIGIIRRPEYLDVLYDCKVGLSIYIIQTKSADKDKKLEWQHYATDYAVNNYCIDETATILYTNSDLYLFDQGAKTDTVFFKAPKVGALQKAVKKMDLSGPVYQVLSLMPLALSVVVLYLGLRKSLQFLLTRLRQA